MKKFLSTLITISFLTGLVMIPTGFALADEALPNGCNITQNISGCPTGFCSFDTAGGNYGGGTGTNCGMCCLLNTIYNVTNWIFIVLIALTVGFVLVGAFFILTAGGNAEQVGKGRQFILMAAIGLLVAFLAKAVPQIVRMLSGF